MTIAKDKKIKDSWNKNKNKKGVHKNEEGFTLTFIYTI